MCRGGRESRSCRAGGRWQRGAAAAVRRRRRGDARGRLRLQRHIDRASTPGWRARPAAVARAAPSARLGVPRRAQLIASPSCHAAPGGGSRGGELAGPGLRLPVHEGLTGGRRPGWGDLQTGARCWASGAGRVLSRRRSCSSRGVFWDPPLRQHLRRQGPGGRRHDGRQIERAAAGRAHAARRDDLLRHRGRGDMAAGTWRAGDPASISAGCCSAHCCGSRRPRRRRPEGALTLFAQRRRTALLPSPPACGGSEPGPPPSRGAVLARWRRVIGGRSRQARLYHRHTRLQRPPHAPELQLHLADEIPDLAAHREALGESAGSASGPSPVREAGCARYLLAHTGEVAGKRVLDVARQRPVGLAAPSGRGASCGQRHDTLRRRSQPQRDATGWRWSHARGPARRPAAGWSTGSPRRRHDTNSPSPTGSTPGWGGAARGSACEWGTRADYLPKVGLRPLAEYGGHHARARGPGVKRTGVWTLA